MKLTTADSFHILELDAKLLINYVTGFQVKI